MTRTSYTYNSLNRLTTLTIGNGTTSLAGYTYTLDPLHNLTSYTYSVFGGQLTSATDALNNTTHYDYTAGYLTKLTDALGHATVFGYDANGNRISQTVKRTNAPGPTRDDYDQLRIRKTGFQRPMKVGSAGKVIRRLMMIMISRCTREIMPELLGPILLTTKVPYILNSTPLKP